MERTVKIGARVGDHLNLSDLEFGTRRVVLTRLLTTEKVANDGRRQALVRDEAVFDGVTKIDQFHCWTSFTTEYSRASSAGSDRACSLAGLARESILVSSAPAQLLHR